MRSDTSQSLILLVLAGTLIASEVANAETGPSAATGVGVDEGGVAERLDEQIVQNDADGHYAISLELAEQQLEIRNRLFGRDHPDVAASLHHVGFANWRLARFARADSILTLALELRRELLGPSHLDLAETLDAYGRLLLSTGEIAEAERIIQEGLAMRRELLGEENAPVAASLHGLGLLRGIEGQSAEAEGLFRQALAMRRLAFGNTHADVASSMIRLALMLRDQGMFPEAEMLMREQLSILRSLHADDHPDVAYGLDNLGLLLRYQGDYAEAEPFLRQAIAMQRRLYGRVHPDLGYSVDNLGFLLLLEGNAVEAEPLFREALAIRSELHGPGHAVVAKSIHNIGLALWAIGDPSVSQEAEEHLRESLDLTVRILGENHQDATAMAHNLGLFLWDQGDWVGAAHLLRGVLSINQSELGDHHPHVALGHLNLAGLLYEQGQDVLAEQHARQGLAITKSTLGERHQFVSIGLSVLGAIERDRGRLASAESLLREATVVHESARLRAGTGISLSRATFQDSPYPLLASVQLQSGNPTEAWISTERHRGRLLADLLQVTGGRPLTPRQRARQDSLEESLDRLASQAGALDDLGSSENLATGPMVATEAERIRLDLLAAEAEWSMLQQEIARDHPIAEGHSFSLERIQQSLSDRTALLGWLEARDAGTNTTSWVYVIRNTGPVQWARLSSDQGAESTDPQKPSRTRAFRDLLTAGGGFHRLKLSSGLLDAAHEAWRERFSSISETLRGVEELVVVPSGEMLGIPVEALVDISGAFLGNSYAISYTPSATIYAWLAEKPENRSPAPGSALLVGDPVLGARQDAAAQFASAEKKDDRWDSWVLLRSALAGNKEALNALWPLPWTRREIEDISPLFPASTVLLGAEANEKTIFQLAADHELMSFDVIHLATHALVDNELPQRSALVLSQVAEADPTTIALVGERIHDGLLTAEEIVRHWDLDASLVTLSACETALGKEVGGEGYIGLAHAFFQAGARSLLVSLWPVNDRATALFMRRFYENRTGAYDEDRGMGPGARFAKSSALREARGWLMNMMDENSERPYAHPFYWAGFVLLGDPR